MSGLASAIDELSMQDAQLLPDTALGSDLVELRRQIDRLEAQWLRRLQVFDARGGGEVDSFPSTASWLHASCRMTHTAAREAVVVARALEERLPGTAAAFEAGEVSYAHARVLARETDVLPPETLAEAEATLLDTAREHDPATWSTSRGHGRPLSSPTSDADCTRRRRGTAWWPVTSCSTPRPGRCCSPR